MGVEEEEMRSRLRTMDVEPNVWNGRLILGELDEELHNLKKGIRPKQRLKKGSGGRWP